MARKHRFRFGLPDVFAGRSSVVQGRRWLIVNSVCCAPHDGRGAEDWRRDKRPPSDSKSPRPIFRRGLDYCDDEYMPVICPTAQVLFLDRRGQTSITTSSTQFVPDLIRAGAMLHAPKALL
jgi:hypothetical protein